MNGSDFKMANNDWPDHDELIGDDHIEHVELDDLTGKSNGSDYPLPSDHPSSQVSSQVFRNESHPSEPQQIQLVIEFTPDASDKMMNSFQKQLLTNDFKVAQDGRFMMIRLSSMQALGEAYQLQIPIWSPQQMEWIPFAPTTDLLCRPSFVRKRLGCLEQSLLCQRAIRRCIRLPSDPLPSGLSLFTSRPMLDTCIEAGLCRPVYCCHQDKSLQRLRAGLFQWIVTFGFCSLPSQQSRQYFGTSITLHLRYLDMFIQWLLPICVLSQMFHLLRLPGELFALIGDILTFTFGHCLIRMYHVQMQSWAQEATEPLEDSAVDKAIDVIEQRLVYPSQTTDLVFEAIAPDEVKRIIDQTHKLRNMLNKENCTTNLYLFVGLCVHLLGSIAFVHSLNGQSDQPEPNSLNDPPQQDSLLDPEWLSNVQIVAYLYFAYTSLATSLGERLLRWQSRSIGQRLQLLDENYALHEQLVALHLVASLFVPLYSQFVLDDWKMIQHFTSALLMIELGVCVAVELLIPFGMNFIREWSNNPHRFDHLSPMSVRFESKRLACPSLHLSAIRCLKLFGIVVLCCGITSTISLLALATIVIQIVAFIAQFGWLYQRPISSNVGYVLLPKIVYNWTVFIVFLRFLINNSLLDTYRHVQPMLLIPINERQWTFFQLGATVLASFSLMKRLYKKYSDDQVEKLLHSIIFQLKERRDELRSQIERLQKTF